MSKINLQEPQRNRNATANFVNLIMTSTVSLPTERWANCGFRYLFCLIFQDFQITIPIQNLFNMNACVHSPIVNLKRASIADTIIIQLILVIS